MTRMPRGLAIVATSAIVLGVACSGSSAKEAPPQKVDASTEQPDSTLVTVQHPEQFPLVTVAWRNVADELSGNCVVSPDVNRMVPVTALGGGRVMEIRARLGDAVTKGQTLLTINSPDLGSANGNYEKAVADEALARKQAERSRLLYQHGSIAQKDLEAAEDAETKAQVDVRTSGEQVKLLGGDLEHPTALIDLQAPISGTIVQQSVTAAAGVKSPDNSPSLFTIADLSRVWLLCDVYENSLSRVRVGEAAQVTLSAYPERALSGRVGNISPLLDSATRTAKVRIELDNAQGLMRPGMFATVALSPTSETRVVVPASAVLRRDDADWVFVKSGASAFRRSPVLVGHDIKPGMREVLRGLSAGQHVVENALQFAQATQEP